MVSKFPPHEPQCWEWRLMIGNYEITHVCLDLLGSWNCDTIHKCTHSRRRTRTNIYTDHTDQHWHRN